MTLYTAAITLILVMDPFGNIPLFISILQQVPKEKRTKVLIRELIIALIVLIFFLYFGQYILSGMNLSQPALSIAGGVILFLIAIRMIFPLNIWLEESDFNTDPIIVPMAVPLVAGPSAMTMVILLSKQHPDQMNTWLVALLIAWAVTAAILMFSEFLDIILGSSIIKATTRLMGMLLTTMAIEMLLSGIKAYFAA